MVPAAGKSTYPFSFTAVCRGSDYYQFKYIIALTMIVIVIVLVIANFYVDIVSTLPAVEGHHAPEDAEAMISLWFTAVDLSGRGGSHIILYLKVAILSASIYASNLIPIILVVGDNPEVEQWFILHNCLIFKDFKHTTVLAFLEQNPQYLTNLGVSTWLRMAIPEVVEALKLAEQEERHENPGKFTGWKQQWQILRKKMSITRTIHYDYVLYTDADVYFINTFTFYERDLPRYVAMPVQGDKWMTPDKYPVNVKRKLRVEGNHKKNLEISKKATNKNEHNPYVHQMHTNAGVMVLNVTSAINEWGGEFDRFIMAQIKLFNGQIG
jgi:hypothetical protein